MQLLPPLLRACCFDSLGLSAPSSSSSSSSSRAATFHFEFPKLTAVQERPASSTSSSSSQRCLYSRSRIATETATLPWMESRPLVVAVRYHPSSSSSSSSSSQRAIVFSGRTDRCRRRSLSLFSWTFFASSFGSALWMCFFFSSFFFFFFFFFFRWCSQRKRERKRACVQKSRSIVRLYYCVRFFK